MTCEAEHYTGLDCKATLRWDDSCPRARWHAEPVKH